MEWLKSHRVFSHAERSRPAPAHPYFPASLELPSYVPNNREVASMLLEFLGMWVVIIGTVWITSSSVSPRLKIGDKLVMIWFVICGMLHCFFEGYFVLNNKTFGSKQDLFAQLWKEYALSDSRYISGDPTVLCAEAITVAVWGPMSFLTALSIVRNSPFRHPLQIVVSVGHLYGDLLYLSTSLVDLFVKGISYSRPEPCYFWFYFMFLNGIWIFVPAYLIVQSVVKASATFSTCDQIEKIYSKRMGITSVPNLNGHIKH